MFYTIYKITNQINGKIYVGSHKTKDLNDSYMGSGKYLKYAQEKYGIENFTKEVLFIFDTPEEMYAKEAELVNEDFIIEENTYNIKVGGFGGFDYINGNVEIVKQRNKTIANSRDHSNAVKALNVVKQTQSYKTKQKEGLLRYYENNVGSFSGRQHTEESKKKISVSRKQNNPGHGEANSQHGTTWIWCEELGNKKIRKDELDLYLDRGWIKTYKPGYKPKMTVLINGAAN